MRDYIAYFKYVIRHKYYVYQAGRGLHLSLWRCIMHDTSKFFSTELSPYVHTFYKKDGTGTYRESEEFDHAWNHHQKTNKHHWQYWVLYNDSGSIVPLKMPEKYVLEMVADWIGAGRAIHGDKSDVLRWYHTHKDKIILHPDTKYQVEKLLEKYTVVKTIEKCSQGRY